MFPGILFLLPLFLIFVNIDNPPASSWSARRPGLIITYLTFTLPFSIWMLAGYFDSIPRELDEAAKVDGCGPHAARSSAWSSRPRRPGIIAVAIYAFMTAWGEVLFASVHDHRRHPHPGRRAAGYSTQTNVYWNQIMAASLVVSVPVVIGFLLLQRYLVAGMTAGAVK